jgi:RNA polymerase sigma-70 factor (ECF subfamily)
MLPTQSASPYSVNLGALDQNAFSALTEPHRRELQAHCYRLVGSLREAEDLVQETFLRAWRRRDTFEGRAPLRAWLHKIATNICLDALVRRPRRSLPISRGAVASLDDPIPPSINEPIWLEPFPDDLLAPEDADPAARYSLRESVTLAFMTSLHLLPPRQRAVLILRDVLDWPASEVADFLGVTVPAVKSALHRARTTLVSHYPVRQIENMAVHKLDETARAQLERYVHVWETADADGLAALLRDDATFSMPPIPSWYQGPEAIRALVSQTVFSGQANRRWRLLPTRANGQPAFGLYRRNEAGTYNAYGIQVVTLAGKLVADITTFQVPALATYFNLPLTLSG